MGQPLVMSKYSLPKPEMDTLKISHHSHFSLLPPHISLYSRRNLDKFSALVLSFPKLRFFPEKLRFSGGRRFSSRWVGVSPEKRPPHFT